MMQWLATRTCVLLAAFVYGGGGVTKTSGSVMLELLHTSGMLLTAEVIVAVDIPTSKSSGNRHQLSQYRSQLGCHRIVSTLAVASAVCQHAARVQELLVKMGIEQFWTDDYKIFEQVYGKTSDRDIYGEYLPPSIIIGRDHKKEASQKNERYLLNLDEDSDEQETLSFGDRYNNLLSKQTLKLFDKNKPATSSINFVSYSDFKPISQSNDPETYSYLKHLEELNNKEKYAFPEIVGGFKPYLNYLRPKPEETDAYKSIQEILDAHEANKESSSKKEEDNHMKYLSYGKSKRKKPPRVNHTVSKHRCVTGRCRKWGAGPYRSRSRPHVRGLKTVIVV